MEREQILKVVVKNIKLNIDGLEDIEIDPEKPMSAYGAESLDIVEVVSSSMRELKIKIPRTELANLSNVNDLVYLFSKCQNGASLGS
jgi:polyketide biosynthesis acyl carrier protein